MNITELTARQLRKAADLTERIQALQDELGQLIGAEAPVAAESPAKPKNGRRKRRKLSPEGLANIRAAQKARWAAKRKGKKGAKAAAAPEPPAGKPKRKRSAAHRKALSAAMKARWAKVKAAGQSRL